MARRFIVDEEDITKKEDNIYYIVGKEVKHIQVLRHDVGDEIVINSGIYKICQMKRDGIVVEYIKDAEDVGIPKICTTLYMAFLKSDKMEFVVQKAVELGVKRIVPFLSSNVVVKLDAKDKAKKRERLQKIADEACKQCGRMDMVEVVTPIEFKELLNEILSDEKVFFAYEASKDSLRKNIVEAKENNINKIGIVIGAEGGFTDKEAQELNDVSNVCTVSLGSRILRAETAALNLLSIIFYEMEG